jgi:hypothetical protein
MNEAYEKGRKANEFARECRERAMCDLPKLKLITERPKNQKIK